MADRSSRGSTMRRGAALTLAALWSCASGPSLEGGRYRDPERGYTVAAPSDAWRRIDAADAELAFRGPEGALMALSTRCDVAPDADPERLARQLRFGLGDVSVREAEAVSANGAPGWRQRLEARPAPEAPPVRVEAVTLLASGCVHDWMLIAPRPSETADEAFAAWWRSFRAPGAPAPEETR